MKEIVVKRMVLSKEEQRVRASWGKLWDRMRNEERKHGHVTLLFGDWSGYRPSQYRITHIDWLPAKVEAVKLKTVLFTDNTTMRVWTEPMTLASLLERGFARRLGYTNLLNEAILTGKDIYVVGEHLEK